MASRITTAVIGAHVVDGYAKKLKPGEKLLEVSIPADYKITKGPSIFLRYQLMLTPKGQKFASPFHPIIRWRVEPGRGRGLPAVICRGIAEPGNPADKRNEYPNMRSQFDVRSSHMPELRDALARIDKDFAAGCKMVVRSLKPADKKSFKLDDIGAMIQWQYPSKDKTTGVEVIKTTEDPNITFGVGLGTHAATSFPTDLRGMPMTKILDYDNVVDGAYQLHPIMERLANPDLLKEASYAAREEIYQELHELFTEGSLIHSITIHADKATLTNKGFRLHWNVYEVVIQPHVPGEIAEFDDDDEVAAALGETDEDAPADDEEAADEVAELDELADDEDAAEDEAAEDEDEAEDEAADDEDAPADEEDVAEDEAADEDEEDALENEGADADKEDADAGDYEEPEPEPEPVPPPKARAGKAAAKPAAAAAKAPVVAKAPAAKVVSKPAAAVKPPAKAPTATPKAAAPKAVAKPVAKAPVAAPATKPTPKASAPATKPAAKPIAKAAAKKSAARAELGDM